MPFLKKIIKNKTINVGIWNITETEEELRSILNKNIPYTLAVDSFKNEARRKQWIACRILLTTLLNDPDAEIIYNETGKPFIRNNHHKISISHSGDLAAVAISYTHAVGIDIEKIRDRVDRVANRFLSKVEMDSIGKENRLEKLHIYWGAKESLYKLAGNPEVDFKNDIIIHSFDYLCNPLQTCQSSMTVSDSKKNYTIYYEEINEYMLVYTYDKFVSNTQ